MLSLLAWSKLLSSTRISTKPEGLTLEEIGKRRIFPNGEETFPKEWAMWSDILKAIEILVKVLSGGSLDTKRRRHFAKDLIRIYLDIDRLLIQGNWIISQLNNPNEATLTAAVIIDQLKIIQSLLDNLNNSKI